MKPEEQAKLAEDLRELGIRGLADFLSHVSRVKKAYEATTGDAKAPNLAELGAKMYGSMPGSAQANPTMNPVMSDYLLDIAKLGTTYYRNLIDLNTAYWSKLSPLGAKDKPVPAERRRLRYDREVSADDERVVFLVDVANKGPEDGRFSFLVSEFRTRDSDGVRPAVTITPPRPRVRAGGSERVTISVPVRGNFEAGKRYRARIAARGPDEIDLILRLRVRGG